MILTMARTLLLALLAFRSARARIRALRGPAGQGRGLGADAAGARREDARPGAVTAQDYVIDLGSGDGRMVIAAAKRGARALGVEYEAEMVALRGRTPRRPASQTRRNSSQGDMFEADISQATVLALFLLPDNLERLTPKFRELTAGTRIVTNGYPIDGWIEETQIDPPDGRCTAWCSAYLYLVPARARRRMEAASRGSCASRSSTRHLAARSSCPMAGRRRGRRRGPRRPLSLHERPRPLYGPRERHAHDGRSQRSVRRALERHACEIAGGHFASGP